MRLVSNIPGEERKKKRGACLVCSAADLQQPTSAISRSFQEGEERADDDDDDDNNNNDEDDVVVG